MKKRDGGRDKEERNREMKERETIEKWEGEINDEEEE